MRKAGILMPISALPSNYGIGDFGKEAREFVDLIADTGFTIWQILPLNTLGYGWSPYQPTSSYAIDERYISLDEFVEKGWIKKPRSFNKKGTHVDYQGSKDHKLNYLKKAYKHFEATEEYEEFCKLSWVNDYAVFAALKEKNNNVEWINWPEKDQRWIKRRPQRRDIRKSVNFIKFVQFTAYTQWKALKAYANSKGVSIMGDMPFYVGFDSADVWANQKQFLLDDKSHPTFIAGVPPDYFSPTGQRWGNPIYDWKKMKKDGFAFWMERIGLNSSTYDYLRIDHFRAFDTYWKIPATCPTALEGQWVEAPGYALFDTLYAKYPDIQLVAEDLGDLRAEVLTLRDHYNLKGMKVIQFAFEAFTDYFKDRENMIVYTGTHDNEPIVSWVNNMSPQDRRKAYAYLRKQGITDKKIHHKFIRFAMNSIGEFAIVPVWDILGLDNEARFNVPSTIGGTNWVYRMVDFKKLEKELPFVKEVITSSNR